MTVREHVRAFAKHSKHNTFYLPATIDLANANQSIPPAWDFSYFDVIIVHYAVRLCFEGYFVAPLANALAHYDGLKLLFIQDEYDATESTRKVLDRVGFDAVFTCVPCAGLDYVYPQDRFPRTDFIQTLTGFVPEDSVVERFALPLEDRTIHIGYRGRKLPHHYGALGYEKFKIGVEVRRLAESRGVPVDIEVADANRIYGDDWYRFLGSCRATLGTESGSNIFDFDGKLKELAIRTASKPFEEVYERNFSPHEGMISMNQVSPKVFEAIRLRTALILFEGKYSDVVQPDQHFIPLKKDFSNVDEVFAKVADREYLRRLTTRAYADVIETGRFSYAAFIAGVDRYIDRRASDAPRAEIISVPILRRRRDEARLELIPYHSAKDFSLNTAVLHGDFQRRALAKIVANHPLRTGEPPIEQDNKTLINRMPGLGILKYWLEKYEAGLANPLIVRALRPPWRGIPAAVRFRMADRLRRGWPWTPLQ